MKNTHSIDKHFGEHVIHWRRHGSECVMRV